MTEKNSKQRSPSSIGAATTKTKAKMYDDDVSGAEAGRWPSTVADPKASAMAGTEKCLLSLLLSLVYRRLPPDFLATGLPLPPQD
jgi:hypothetical protein